MFESFGKWLAGSVIDDIVIDTVLGAANGALIGGITAELTGGSFSDGAKIGAIGGAVYSGGKSTYDNWDGLVGSPESPSSVYTPDVPAQETSAPASTDFTLGSDKFATNDKFSLGTQETTGGLLDSNIDTTLNFEQGAGSDQSFLNSLKSGFSDLTPAQGKFYGQLLNGVGSGIISMEKAKELKKAADLRYKREKETADLNFERTRLKVQPSIANRSRTSPVPRIV